MLKFVLVVLLTTLTGSMTLADQGRYPKGPDARLTPGSYCTNPDNLRYKEKIPYCNRNVNSDEKWAVIDMYNAELGYRITRGERQQFKIDHLIPLCAGGSNNMNNLWPQHVSVYTITDPIEGLACDRMKQGKLTQKRAIELIFEAKNNLSRASDVIDELTNM